MKAELWSEVERALDARRSPFEEGGLAARLAREPEAERAVRRLLERLGRLGRLEGAVPRRRGLWLAAVAGAVVAGVAWFGFARRGEAVRAPDLRLRARFDARHDPDSERARRRARGQLRARSSGDPAARRRRGGRARGVVPECVARAGLIGWPHANGSFRHALDSASEEPDPGERCHVGGPVVRGGTGVARSPRPGARHSGLLGVPPWMRGRRRARPTAL